MCVVDNPISAFLVLSCGRLQKPNSQVRWDRPSVGHFPFRTFPLAQTVNQTLTLTLILTLLTPVLALTLTEHSRGMS